MKLFAPITNSIVFQNRTLLAVCLTVCASYVGIGMVGPVRVLYAQSQGASLVIIGAMASAYLISNFVFQYPTGWLADRWGRKQVIIAGLLAQATLSLAYLFVTNPILFVVLRFMEGIAAAAILPSTRALLIDVVPSGRQGEAYGVFNAFFNAGFLIGPGIGGFIATTRYESAFIGAALFRLLAVIIVLTLIHPKAQSTHKTQKQVEAVSYKALFTLPLIGLYILVFGDYLYLGFDLTLMPIWMHNNLGASVAVIGIAYMAWAIPNIIFSPIGGRVADRIRRSLLIFIFGLAQVPLYFTYGLASSGLLIVVLFAVHGAVFAMIQPAVDSLVASSSVPHMRARVQGLYASIGLIGAFVSAIGLSPLYAISFRLPLFAMGVVFSVCILIGNILVRVAEARGMMANSNR